jgi:phosphatidylglycerol---prolipoprotein diacylglyceryl transferase
MYPNLYYAIKDILGVDPGGWAKFINSFGFFVAIGFVTAAVLLAREFKRKEKQGLLTYKEEKITVGKPASVTELILNFLLGFLMGYKIIGAFLSDGKAGEDPQAFILSAEGSWPAGIVLGLLFAGLKWWEKKKNRLAKPEERQVRIWPKDRVGDITIIAAISGFLGAKLFHNFENWSDFVKDPIGELLSFSGLTFYGGLLCAAVAVIWYCSRKGIKTLHLIDAVAPSLIIAYAIGRIGCQVSGDGDWGIVNSAYIANADGTVQLAGSPQQVKDSIKANAVYYTRDFGSVDNVKTASFKAPSFLPDWMVAYTYPHNVNNQGKKLADCTDGQFCNYLPAPVFPTPFYETVAGLLIFFFLWAMRKRIKIPGQLFALYLMLNGLERFAIEKIRVNTTYSIMGFHPTQAEIIAALLFLFGLALFFWTKKRAASAAKAS